MTQMRLYRAIWWALTSLLVATFIVASFARFQELREPCKDSAQDECAEFFLNSNQQTTLDDLGISLELYAAFQIGTDALPPLAYLTVGILMMRRTVVSREHAALALGIVATGLIIIPETLSALERGSLAMIVLFVIAWTTAQPAFAYVVATFPNGRFMPRWMLWAFFVMSVGWGLERLEDVVIDRESLGGMGALLTLLITAGWIACLAILAGQISRYRNLYSRVERQQIKWVLFGIASIIAGAIVWIILFTGLGDRSDSSQLWLYLLVFPLIIIVSCVFPATIATAIFRYRLYDIDIILNRALVYSALTAALGATYVLLVVGGSSLLRTLASGSTELVVAASTLLVASVFRPLRNRIQSSVDRRFYRRKYDTRRTLEEFSVTAREAVDLDQLTGELTKVVGATMQPEHLSVWLRSSRAEESQT